MSIMSLCFGTNVARRGNSGDPKGIRTPVTAVKGQCPGPLDDGVVKAALDLAAHSQEINLRARWVVGQFEIPVRAFLTISATVEGLIPRRWQ